MKPNGLEEYPQRHKHSSGGLFLTSPMTHFLGGGTCARARAGNCPNALMDGDERRPSDHHTALSEHPVRLCSGLIASQKESTNIRPAGP